MPNYPDVMQVVHAADSTDEVMILGLLGDLDLSSVPTLRSAGMKILADGWNRVVVDLAAVDFIDSAGLGVLIGLRRRCLLADGECVLVIQNTEVLRVLETSEVDRLFRLYESTDAAATALRGARA